MYLLDKGSQSVGHNPTEGGVKQPFHSGYLRLLETQIFMLRFINSSKINSYEVATKTVSWLVLIT